MRSNPYPLRGPGGRRNFLLHPHPVERLESRTLFAAADLDPGFSGDGKAVVDYVGSRNDYATAIVVLNDGRVLVAGAGDPDTPGGVVARYLADGRPDTSFGQGGKLKVADLGFNGVGALAAFADGSFIAGGSSLNPASPDPYITLRKFTPTGAPHPAWVPFSTGVHGSVSDVIPLAGGKSLILAGGVWKLNADGTPDTSFGDAGRMFPGFSAFAAALQANGSIVVAGQRANSFDPGTSAVARITSSGVVDTAFGSDGVAFLGRGQFRHVLVQPDGRIVAGGYSGSGVASYVARLNANGTRDATFGNNGERTFDLAASGFECVTGLLRRNDGSFQLGGFFNGHTFATGGFFPDSNPYLARITAGGQLDPAYGGDGVIDQHLPAGWTGGGMANIAFATDGRLIVAAGGSPSLNDTIDLAVTRHGSDGSRDTTFGGGAAGGAPGGVVRTDSTASVARRVGRSAVQADGKVLLTGSQTNVAASFLLARLNLDGTPDTPFGTRGDGVAVADFGERREFARDVAVQPDRKLVVAGRVDDGEAPGDPSTHPGDYAIVRFNENGTLDNSFGTGGRVRTNFGGTGEGFSLVEVQRDGKILAAGTSGNIGSETGVVVRYLANGQLDTGFGDGGRVVIAGGIVTLLPLAGGGVLVAGGRSGSYVARLTAAGLLDPAFGTAGTGFATFITTSPAVGLAFGAGGLLYLASAPPLTLGAELTLTRFSPGGVVDTTFGTDGRRTHTWRESPTAFASTPGGQLLVAGEIPEAALGRQFLVARLQADGSYDASFGSNGFKSIDMGSPRDVASDLHLDATGRIIVTGASLVGRADTQAALQMNHWAVARLNGSGVAPPPAVTGAEFIPTAGRQVLRLTFSGDVYDKLNAGRRVVVSDRFGGFNYASSQYVVTRGVGGGPTTVELVFSGSTALRDGNYRATLQPADVTDGQGIPMTAPFTFNFFVLAGDINRDRRVDSVDFATLAGNFGRTGMTYAQGDLNGDGRVDSADFALLAANFGKALPAAATTAAPAVAATTTTAPRSAPAARRQVSPPQPTRPVRRLARPAARRRSGSPL